MKDNNKKIYESVYTDMINEKEYHIADAAEMQAAIAGTPKKILGAINRIRAKNDIKNRAKKINDEILALINECNTNIDNIKQEFEKIKLKDNDNNEISIDSIKSFSELIDKIKTNKIISFETNNIKEIKDIIFLLNGNMQTLSEFIPNKLLKAFLNDLSTAGNEIITHIMRQNTDTDYYADDTIEKYFMHKLETLRAKYSIQANTAIAKIKDAGIQKGLNSESIVNLYNRIYSILIEDANSTLTYNQPQLIAPSTSNNEKKSNEKLNINITPDNETDTSKDIHIDGTTDTVKATTANDELKPVLNDKQKLIIKMLWIVQSIVKTYINNKFMTSTYTKLKNPDKKNGKTETINTYEELRTTLLDENLFDPALTGIKSTERGSLFWQKKKQLGLNKAIIESDTFDKLVKNYFLAGLLNGGFQIETKTAQNKSETASSESNA